ncbi:MAG: DUF2064 domain-containing protein [Motiliproteus sp.]
MQAAASGFQATLVLLFKRPLIGQGKQRLAASVGPERARVLAEHFLRCALEDLAAWQGPVVLAPADPHDRVWAEQLFGRAQVVPQGDGNLGQRIIALDRQLRNLGHRYLVYIGSDAPALTPGHYRSVRHQLAHTDVVLSAADDGGVTIMACAHPWPVALIELPWSTDQLGETLAGCCQQQGLRLSYMEPSYDVDVELDLPRLRADLASDVRPARQALFGLLQTLAVSGAYPDACASSYTSACADTDSCAADTASN